MSMHSELRARLGTLVPDRGESPRQSSSDERVPILLRLSGPLDKPVSLVKTLRGAGLRLRVAHDVVGALANESSAVCEIPGDADADSLGRELSAMNVTVLRRRLFADPAAIVAEVRNRHGLSQRAFAAALGLDVRTLQNWEQGRNRPDSAVLSLVLLFDRDPRLVEDAAFEPVGEPAG